MLSGILESLFREQFGAAALDSLRRSFATPDGEAAAAEFYKEVRARLLAAQPVEPGLLERLGRERGSAIAGAMPKSAFAANAQAKTCAAAVARLLTGAAPSVPKLINTCYSLVAPDYGISVAGVYAPANGQIAEVAGSGGVSPVEAPATTRAAEAGLAGAWFRTITGEVFG